MRSRKLWAGQTLENQSGGGASPGGAGGWPLWEGQGGSTLCQFISNVNTIQSHHYHKVLNLHLNIYNFYGVKIVKSTSLVRIFRQEKQHQPKEFT